MIRVVVCRATAAVVIQLLIGLFRAAAMASISITQNMNDKTHHSK